MRWKPGNRAGWLDSLNGLPGLFGSSICESLELLRACRLLLQCIDLSDLNDDHPIPLFRELHEFIAFLSDLLALQDLPPFAFWDRSHNRLELFREKTRLGIHGEMVCLTIGAVKGFLRSCSNKLEQTFQFAPEADLYHESGVPYTYFINEVSKTKSAMEDSEPGSHGETFIPTAFSPRPLALFLEGPVHYLRVFPDRAREIYGAVKRSSLLDPALEMYRCCESLDNEPLEIGRIKAYAEGWLENGSIYTHMEYKWLLEILKAGLVEEFFKELRSLLVPFMPPEQYGRSTLENCSFIASSAFPDHNFHGQAFQPRLSGMTCEFLNIWALMTAGKTPFQVNESGSLICKLQPVLPEWIFTTEEIEIAYPFEDGNVRKIQLQKDSFAFTFLGSALVIYENPLRKPTAGPDSVSVKNYTLTSRSDGSTRVVSGAFLTGQDAHRVRAGAFETILIRLG